MSDRPICPVILSGGTGTRLWPVSRAARPKQFARLAGEATLLGATIARLEDAGCGAPIFVTNANYRWAVAAEAEARGLVGHRIVLEPAARSTAAAIAAAALLAHEDDPDTLLLIAPSDHLMTDALQFADAIARGAARARDGGIVVFGVRPDRAEPGYGHIELPPDADATGPHRYLRFVEKPDAARAARMAASGRYLWNAGLFLATASTLKTAFETHAPEVAVAVADALATATRDLDFLRLGPGFASAPAAAFDTAIMEKTDGWVVPMQAGWSDLGSWHGVWDAADHDADGNARIGPANTLDCENTLLLSSDDTIRLVGLGLRNIAAVATRDGVLVADMDQGQDVARAVALLRERGARQADTFDREDRPWGQFETLARGPRFHVKTITVRPGGTLSLQSHVHRAEHWIVVEGTANVTIGSEERLVTENQSVYIPLGVRHRLENRGKVPLRLIEVQTGAYLEEDDIERFEDVYQRT